MFNQKLHEKIKQLEQTIADKNHTTDKLNERIRFVESQGRIAENEMDMRVNKVTQDKDNQIKDLEIEVGIVKKENEILKAAFKNLGFDVKDMKEILNKLVDGVISKNEIKVLKS